MHGVAAIWHEISHWPADQRLALARRLLASLQDELYAPAGQLLREMAEDPQVRRELAAMAEDFGPTEMDGLEEKGS